ncbi:MAG TPA: hypothetical protein VFO55_13435 [Gemmatimonadaceae bacterium]|nr:hypothetical protein [Gemmatimonadaceae bacterium]
MPFAVNAFSRRFAERLIAAHPAWSTLVQPDPHGFPAPGSLLVVVPSPVAHRELLIQTAGDQVTVAFGADGWHEHFGPEEHGGEEPAISAALRVVADLLADRKVVVTRYLFGRRLWSRAVDATSVRAPRLGATRVTSWSGAGDATLTR